ncbi:putative modulator of DNA gyrase TldD [Candidatus Phytoplasma phoenicium]|uniref:Putative modulator of DNA gyrase TldD n=2 Tax=Candidatus Phytoplasma phoenicium TaxID=198422 RepID=A0A0L0MJ81_9MOLU|nr:putative modulator of DNA gyrase TldD [Candidatus Phytoplasma phoenicium]
MLLTKIEIENILQNSLNNGVNFVELFFEDKTVNVLKIINDEIVGYKTDYIFGVGIRLLKHTDEIYIYTNQVEHDHILNLILAQKKAWKGDTKASIVPFNETSLHQKGVHASNSNMDIKTIIPKLLHLSQIMKRHDERISQSIVNFRTEEQKVLIANSLGVYQQEVRNYINCSLIAIARVGDNIQEFSDKKTGRCMNIDFFDLPELEQKALKVAEKVILLLSAQQLKPQKIPVVINNGVGGVIFHEACGHSLEATAITKGLSPFYNKINQKIASELITAYDDGTIEGTWGQTLYDDEGKLTQKNLLIEKGILKNYLIDYRNGLKMNMLPTGSARRQSYKYAPTSRMNSTYIVAGTDTPAQIIQDTQYGFYAESLGGGTVMTSTGEFNFMVNLGYLIENGKLTTPIKNMMLIGTGQDILLKIDRVGNDLAFDQGYCGSISGYVPVDLGQPTIRVQEMIIGGSKKDEK